MKRKAASLVCFLSIACAACGGSSATGIGDNGNDGGGPSDDAGGLGNDGSSPSTGEDAGAPSSGEDSGSPSSNEDSGPSTEDGGASTGEDAGGGVDANTPVDAGTDATTTADDAGSPVDASTPVDAGSAVDAAAPDAGSEPEDAGVDAGVDAGFDAGPPPNETLTVTTSGWGIVTAAGSTLSCPGTCTATYPMGTVVTLTAAPSTDQTLTAWGGACSGSSATCEITLDGATTASAAFTATYPASATPVDESYACTLSVPLGGVNQAATLSVTTQGAAPLQVPPGTTFNLPLFQTVATIPASVVNTAAGDNCTQVSGSITILDVDATEGATTQTVNAVTGAATSYAFGPIALTENTPVVLSLPKSPLTIGTFKASSTSAIDFTPGAETTSLSATLSFTCDGISGIPGTLTCTAGKPAAAFATTTVQ